MVVNALLLRPCPRGITIKDNGVIVANTFVTLYNVENNGATREKTNSIGRAIFDLSNFKANNATVGYTNGDEIQIVVGGISAQDKIKIKR